MELPIARRAYLLAAALLAASGCSANAPVPANPSSALAPNAISQDDSTSILKLLKKNVLIGSTVDPTNGDKGPHALSVAKANYGGLKVGQLVVCNFEDKSGKAGDGTTIDLFDPTPGSKPKTFAQSTKIEGCDGDAVSLGDYVYGAGMTSGVVKCFTPSGKPCKAYGLPLKEPFDDVDVACPGAISRCLYSAEYIYASDASTGAIVTFSINGMGNIHETQVADGFAVNKKSGWSALGPSGLAYSYYTPKDTLFVADGVDNTVVAFQHASNLLITNEIVVEKGGKTFKCKFPKSTCGTLVYAGSPLEAPEAMTLLPNGNVIVANTKNNTLVEIDTSTKKVLATKVVDTSKNPGIFALAATGTKDSNTALFFTDTNSNDLRELEQ
jgi:hypothetical protein